MKQIIPISRVKNLDVKKSKIKINKNTEIVAQVPFIDVLKRTYNDKKGKEMSWNYVIRPNGRDPVSVYASDTDGKFLFIAQPRVPLDKYVISMPAGLRDFPNEDAYDVAKREVKEETGYTITDKNLKSKSNSLPKSAGLTTESDTFVEVSLDKKMVGKTTMESSEDIVSFWATPKEFMDMQKNLNPDKIVIENGAYSYMKGFTDGQKPFCDAIKKHDTKELKDVYKKYC